MYDQSNPVKQSNTVNYLIYFKFYRGYKSMCKIRRNREVHN